MLYSWNETQKRDTMTTAEKTGLRVKIRELNLQINSQLKRAGILNHKGQLVTKLADHPNKDWKEWITELIAIRDEYDTQYDA